MVLEEALKATLARWWETHNKSINGWLLCHRLMEVHFSEAEHYQVNKYDGCNDPSDHLISSQTMWVSRPKNEWEHDFVRTLDKMPR